MRRIILSAFAAALLSSPVMAWGDKHHGPAVTTSNVVTTTKVYSTTNRAAFGGRSVAVTPTALLFTPSSFNTSTLSLNSFDLADTTVLSPIRTTTYLFSTQPNLLVVNSNTQKSSSGSDVTPTSETLMRDLKLTDLYIENMRLKNELKMNNELMGLAGVSPKPSKDVLTKMLLDAMGRPKTPENDAYILKLADAIRTTP